MRVLVDGRAAQRRQAGGLGTMVRHLNEWLPRVALSDERIEFLPNAASPATGRGRIGWYARFSAACLLGQVDLIHSTHSLMLPVISPRPTVLTIPDLSAIHRPQHHTVYVRESWRAMLMPAARRARHIIVISETVRKELLNFIPDLEGRVTVVPLGVDMPADDQPPSDLSHFLFLGNLEPRKNLTRVIEAYALLRSRLGNNCPGLVIAGGRGWGDQDPMRIAARVGVTTSVKWLGYVDEDEKRRLLRNAVATVYPSLAEGFGLPVLESMAIGTPVVTSNLSAMAEVAGSAALLVSPTDVDGIARAMEILVTQPDERARLRTAGIERARQFSWRRCAQGVLGVYRTALCG